MTKPLLVLSMIVKDEAATIEATLRSVAPFIDRYVILDTGSTDDTQSVITRVMAELGVTGYVQTEAFVDFAAARNLALAYAANEAVWTLYLDADDVLTNADGLRESLLAYVERLDTEAFRLDVEVPHALFASTRIVRNSGTWKFVGATHEVLVGPGTPVRILGPVIKHFPAANSQARSRARWQRDVQLLRAAVDKDPNNTRSWFYLGLTHSWLGQYTEAYAALSKRIALGGWDEEIYYAKLQIARGFAAQLSDNNAQRAYLDAYAARPTRAEPLYELAHHYHRQGNHALCLHYAKPAFEMKLPVDDVLFVDREVYLWKAAELVSIHAYYLGAFELGERAARQVLIHHPSDERLQRNLQFYVERLR